MQRRARVFRSAASSVLLIASACGGGGGTTTNVISISRVAVAGSLSTLGIGQNVQLSATAYDASNAVVSNPGVVTWSSNATSIVTVDQAGKASAVSSGDAVVTATVAGVKGTFGIRVNLASAVKDTIYTVGIATFSPSVVSIARGTTVIFSLGQDGVGHDVQFNAKTGAPAYIPVQSRSNVPVTFTTSGDFTYFCPTHPQMTGTVSVQ